MVSAKELLKTRVTPDTKRVIQALAQRQQLTEAAWLRRLIEITLQNAGTDPSDEIDRRQPAKRPRLVGAMAIVDQCLTCKARLAYHLGK